MTANATPLAAGKGWAVYVYQSTTSPARWDLVGHDQGAAITYTPTITASSGTFTTVSATGSYYAFGRSCRFHAQITVTTVGSAAGTVLCTLPIPNSAVALLNGQGVNDLGASLSVYAGTSATSATIWDYAGAFPGGSGRTLSVGATYTI